MIKNIFSPNKIKWFSCLDLKKAIPESVASLGIIKTTKFLAQVYVNHKTDSFDTFVSDMDMFHFY